MTCLPDVNIWIAVSAERHVFHPAAKTWFNGLTDEKLLFCRVTQLGFLRPLTNSHVMADEVMTPDQAWQAYRLLRSNRFVGYAEEPRKLPEVWSAFTEGKSRSSNIWTDSYLCAFAYAAGMRLVTFDAKIPTREGFVPLVLKSDP